jgi:hypothetical protein
MPARRAAGEGVGLSNRPAATITLDVSVTCRPRVLAGPGICAHFCAIRGGFFGGHRPSALAELIRAYPAFRLTVVRHPTSVRVAHLYAQSPWRDAEVKSQALAFGRAGPSAFTA